MRASTACKHGSNVILSEECSLREQRREQPQSKDPYPQNTLRKARRVSPIRIGYKIPTSRAKYAREMGHPFP